ncbi:MAG: hypothetical protein KGI98_12090 [Euryarchaeota archaeon]|nr:hypothetical protein [Euryarchaeota archaeon]MDE1881210.1 hypothetical protein [Euryarchaeota archaeon]
MNYIIWFAGSLTVLAGVIGLLLTHFGVVAGFRVISPVLFGAGATMYLVALGIRQPIAVAVAMGILTVFFELTIYFDLWGLGSAL